MSFTRNRLPPSALVALVITLLPLASLGTIKTRLLQLVSPSAQAIVPVTAPANVPAVSRDRAPKLAAASVSSVRP